MEKKVWFARFACAVALGLLCCGVHGGVVDTFAAAVENLVNTAETWRVSLSGAVEAEEAKAEMDGESENGRSNGRLPGSLSSNGFLQV